MFKHVGELQDNVSALHWLIRGIDAFDPDRNLAISKTGSDDNPRWCIMRTDTEHRTSSSGGMVRFRADTVVEAVQKANTDKRLVNHIAKVFAYDCTADVREHQRKVKYWMRRFWGSLQRRSEVHDNSKLNDPEEKAMFDHWTPALREATFGSDQYKMALDGMGEGVQRHYRANRHHPEHYENGVNGMTLIDVVEMVADWMAAAEAKMTHVDLDHAAQRFNLAPQLVDIIANTLREEDFWNGADNIPAPSFCPPDRTEGHIEGITRKSDSE
jgi:hypothetical protein